MEGVTMAVDTRRGPSVGHSALAVAAIALGLLLVTGTVSYLIARSHQPGTPVFLRCAGVITGATGSSPEAALGAWLAALPDEPPASAWHRHGDTFVNNTYDHGRAGHGSHQLEVGYGPALAGAKGGPSSRPSPGSSGSAWSVTGLCD
jgi:hypothetical protein